MSKFKSANFDAYAAAIRQRESSGDYTKVNDGGYTGAYQFGKSALIDAGFMDQSGSWTSYAQSLGVNSMEDLKNNPEAQDTAFQNLTEKNWDYLRNYLPYIGQTIGGVPITVSGLLAGAHLVGHGGVKKFLDSNGTSVPVDGNGTPITEYMKKFGGYDFSFDNNRKGFGGVLGAQPQAVPYLAQTQAVDPAFGATQWLQRPTSPNVLQSDAASPFAPSVGTPEYAATPYMSETRRAQQVLDTLPHAPSAAPQLPPTASPARSPQFQPTRPGIRAPLNTTPQSPELLPGMPIPGATGPSVIGGPGALRPLAAPASSRPPAPTSPIGPAVDPTLPPLHFAPETPQNFGPFEVPKLIRSDVLSGSRIAPGADDAGINSSIPAPMPTVGTQGYPRPPYRPQHPELPTRPAPATPFGIGGTVLSPMSMRSAGEMDLAGPAFPFRTICRDRQCRLCSTAACPACCNGPAPSIRPPADCLDGSRNCSAIILMTTTSPPERDRPISGGRRHRGDRALAGTNCDQRKGPGGQLYGIPGRNPSY